MISSSCLIVYYVVLFSQVLSCGFLAHGLEEVVSSSFCSRQVNTLAVLLAQGLEEVVSSSFCSRQVNTLAVLLAQGLEEVVSSSFCSRQVDTLAVLLRFIHLVEVVSSYGVLFYFSICLEGCLIVISSGR
jgi:hypothetical protein